MKHPPSFFAKLASLAIVLLLTGCASPDYQHYLSAQTANATAQAQADAARYQALATIAQTDGTAAVAAAMALAMGGQRQVQIAAPQPNAALQWASVLVPALGQAYAVGQNARVSIAASDNSVRNTQAMTGGFVAIASQIQAPVIAAPVLPQAHVTTTTTTDNSRVLSGTGTLGSGAYSTTDRHDVSSPIVQIVPNVLQPTVIQPVFQPTP